MADFEKMIMDVLISIFTNAITTFADSFDLKKEKKLEDIKEKLREKNFIQIAITESIKTANVDTNEVDLLKKLVSDDIFSKELADLISNQPHENDFIINIIDLWTVCGGHFLKAYSSAKNQVPPLLDPIHQAFICAHTYLAEKFMEKSMDAFYASLQSPLAASPENQSNFKHSPDYRSVTIPGKEPFILSPTQAAVIKILNEAWENGSPIVGQSYILEEIGVTSPSTDIQSIFKRNKRASLELITSPSKGCYQIKR